MKRSTRTPILGVLLGLVVVTAIAAEPTIVTSRQTNWVRQDVPKGGEQAALWNAATGTDQGMLVRWPSRTKLPAVTLDHEIRIVVMAGTFTVDVDGKNYELGPGGFVRIPAGTKHELGCEAAGQCILVMHRSAAATATGGG